MELINISNKNLQAPHLEKEGLEKLIILPDYCPGKGRLPVGSIAIYDSSRHILNVAYLGPDIGCGFRLAKFIDPLDDVERSSYRLASQLKKVKKGLGSLGRGSHFINFYKVDNSELPELNQGDFVVLIHTGSREKGKSVFEQKLTGQEYFKAYKEALKFAAQNRETILKQVESSTENFTQTLYDLSHNTIDQKRGKIIYRKGAARVGPGEIGIIPSYIGGKLILVKAKNSIRELANSMCHGTGRKLSRSESKKLEFDSKELRRNIVIPNTISDAGLKTEAPHCYRTIEEILPQIKDYVSVVAELNPLSYVG